MHRITQNDLEILVKRINVMTNSPVDSYTKTDGKFKANIGNYHLSYAYGGVSLHRMYSDGGGITKPISCGYVSKRELYHLIHAFLNGIEQGEKL